VCGFSNAPNISVSQLFVTFIDDCTRVNWVYILKQKCEATSVFLHFFSVVKTQFGVSIKIVMSDNLITSLILFVKRGYYSRVFLF